MTELKGSAAERFIREPRTDIAAVLLYGPDEGLARERAQQIVRAAAGSLDDPFNVVRLDDARLALDPGRLADEMNALSLMGGRRVIWVGDAATAFAKAVEPLLGQGSVNLIVAEAGALKKEAKLRSLFEASPWALALPCFADSDDDLRALIGAELARAKLAIEPDALACLVGLLGADRALSRQEVDKLALYGQGRGTIGLDDVEAICGDAADLSADALGDAVLEGRLAEADAAFERLIEAGQTGGRLLSLLAGQIARLEPLRLEVDRGRPAEAAVKAARPPVFFSRQAPLVRQLRRWDAEALAKAAAQVHQAIRQTREYPALEAAIASRAFLALARSASR